MDVGKTQLHKEGKNSKGLQNTIAFPDAHHVTASCEVIQVAQLILKNASSSLLIGVHQTILATLGP